MQEEAGSLGFELKLGFHVENVRHRLMRYFNKNGQRGAGVDPDPDNGADHDVAAAGCVRPVPRARGPAGAPEPAAANDEQ